jgi:hypothetical protein
MMVVSKREDSTNYKAFDGISRIFRNLNKRKLNIVIRKRLKKGCPILRLHTLFPRRMPPGRSPFNTDSHSKRIIQLQRHNRSAPTGRKPGNHAAVVAPLKMICPFLVARIKQRHALAGIRVNRINLLALEAVTQAAGQPEIFFVVVPTPRSGHEMFDFELAQYQFLRTQAVTAAITGLFANPISQTAGNAHGVSGA